MGKNSFTIFELLVSILILSIVISGFFFTNTNNSKEFQTLNSLDNIFNTDSYKSIPYINTSLTLKINDNKEEILRVKKYFYKNDNMELVKYE